MSIRPLIAGLVLVFGPGVGEAQTADPLTTMQGRWVARSENGNDVVEVTGKTITLKVKGARPQLFQQEATGTVVATIAGAPESFADGRNRFPSQCTSFEGGQYVTDTCNVWLNQTGAPGHRYYTLTIGYSDFMVRAADKARGFY